MIYINNTFYSKGPLFSIDVSQIGPFKDVLKYLFTCQTQSAGMVI